VSPDGKTNLMRSCPKCAARITPGTRRIAQHVGGRDFLLKVPAGTCRLCGTGYLDAESLEWGELQIACRLAMEGPANGATLRALRKSLGFLAAQLAEMLGITAETISRWETGQRRVERSAWIVVGSMVLEKANVPACTLARLKAVTCPPSPEVVTIDARPEARAAERRSGKRISGVERKGSARRE
jgi:transcriptional regulator with XRE-family HTH domain